MLIYAEAHARSLGNWNNAETLAAVNAIRTRAGVATFSSLTADTFLAERGREMFQESSRRTDLIRFGKYSSGTWWEKGPSPAHKQLMPIPFDAIQSSNGSLSQNPGY